MKNNSSSDGQQKTVRTRKKTAKAVTEFGEKKLYAMAAAGDGSGRLTVGLDLGDRSSRWCALGADGEVMGRGEVESERQGLERFFGRIPKSLVALEVGSHSPWISRLLEKLGHEVVVANARRVKPISESSRKNDDVGAELLARLARADRRLLSPVIDACDKELERIAKERYDKETAQLRQVWWIPLVASECFERW